MNEVTRKILFSVLCLVLPILWGILVNWLFNLWRSRPVDHSQDEPIFPDYQI